MFDIGLGELVVIALVVVVVMGPDRLPEFAAQAGRFVRRLKKYADAARDDLRRELGPEYADLELRDLDPRRIVRQHLTDALRDDPADEPVRDGLRPLEPGERPPYDTDAT
ncbi:sec-independent translocase [Nocardioides jejuensis]|uniref:Twin-arginine translocase subunit TatB n=1 Tax=Nocardioides jejuensis TaxID=2502782 RepID=A0A4R1BWM9_9ACTN|nr:sec-independent translocase [Nocardioides jejuensis]TCJ22419.1 twin-arginine translocase subunit TatB [Nocardioides jejuensis]